MSHSKFEHAIQGIDRRPARAVAFWAALGMLALGALALGVRPLHAQADTYRVILYIAEDGAPTDITLKRVQEVWREGEGVERLRALLSASSIQQLDAVTVLPGGDTPAIRIGDVTFRVQGVLKEPRRDSMLLRVEVDGGKEALVKEMVSKFDETIVLAYPLTEGNRSIVALIVPAGGT